MSKITKRIFALLLVLVMALSAVGCGGGGNTDDNKETGGTIETIDVE